MQQSHHRSHNDYTLRIQKELAELLLEEATAVPMSTASAQLKCRSDIKNPFGPDDPQQVADFQKSARKELCEFYAQTVRAPLGTTPKPPQRSTELAAAQKELRDLEHPPDPPQPTTTMAYSRSIAKKKAIPLAVVPPLVPQSQDLAPPPLRGTPRQCLPPCNISLVTLQAELQELMKREAESPMRAQSRLRSKNNADMVLRRACGDLSTLPSLPNRTPSVTSDSGALPPLKSGTTRALSAARKHHILYEVSAAIKLQAAWRKHQATLDADRRRHQKSILHVEKRTVDAASVVRSVWMTYKAKRQVAALRRSCEEKRLTRLEQEELARVQHAALLTAWEEKIATSSSAPVKAIPEDILEMRAEYDRNAAEILRRQSELQQRAQEIKFLHTTLVQAIHHPNYRFILRRDAVLKIQRNWRLSRKRKNRKTGQ